MIVRRTSRAVLFTSELMVRLNDPVLPAHIEAIQQLGGVMRVTRTGRCTMKVSVMPEASANSLVDEIIETIDRVDGGIRDFGAQAAGEGNTTVGWPQALGA